jgi:type II secretory pathway component PulJ
MTSEQEVPVWIKLFSHIIISTVTIGLLSMIFFYREFETQARASGREYQLNQRLDRIENKLDRLIEQGLN